MSTIKTFLKRIFCRHKYEEVYCGKSVLFIKTIWECPKCGSTLYSLKINTETKKE